MNLQRVDQSKKVTVECGHCGARVLSRTAKVDLDAKPFDYYCQTCAGNLALGLIRPESEVR